MKKITKLVELLIICAGLLSMNVLEKDFHVRIEQNGELIEPVNGVVTLDKKEFNIMFEFSEPMGLARKVPSRVTVEPSTWYTAADPLSPVSYCNQVPGLLTIIRATSTRNRRTSSFPASSLPLPCR